MYKLRIFTYKVISLKSNISKHNWSSFNNDSLFIQMNNELLDFFGMDTQSPSSSAFSQQREKLKPEAMKKIFDSFTWSIPSCNGSYPGYRIIAADGSTASYFSHDKYSPPDEYL